MSKRILFVGANRVGDAVLTTGLLHHLVETQHNARFTIVSGPLAADLFRAVPRLERVIPLPKMPLSLHWWQLIAMTAWRRWDMIVDMRRAVPLRLLRTKEWRVFKRAEKPLPKVLENARVLDLPKADPHIWLDDRARKDAERALPGQRMTIAIAPTASWPRKEWSMTNWLELINRLTRPGAAFDGARLALIGGKAEAGRAHGLLKVLSDKKPVNLMGKLDILATAAAINKAHLYIGNDSGPTHLAAALGVPTLGLYGAWGIPAVYAPWGPKAAFVHGPGTRDQTNLSMANVAVDAVERAVLDLHEEIQVAD